MKPEEDDEYTPTQTWNRQEKKSKLSFYVIIAVFCFVLAWVMSGA